MYNSFQNLNDAIKFIRSLYANIFVTYNNDFTTLVMALIHRGGLLRIDLVQRADTIIMLIPTFGRDLSRLYIQSHKLI